MTSWLQHFRAIARCLWRLRPHLRSGRNLVGAVVLSSLVAALLEGVGVSLLVPLLSLLLGGEGATPMRPIQWLHEWFPGHGAAFYVVAFCGLVLCAIAGKNGVFYLTQVLAARLRSRITANLRLSLFKRLHSADMHLFEMHTAGDLANVFFNETTRTVSMVDFLLLFGQRASIALFYLAMLLFISWPLTLITVLLAALIGVTVVFIYRRLAGRGREIVELNQKFSALVMESFSGIRVVRSTHSEEREIARFTALDATRVQVDERAARTSSLVAPITETVAVAGAMIIIGCAYYFFVRSHAMLSSYLLGFGFILLRLLPLINQLYALQGQLIYFAGGAQEVGKWLDTPLYPHRPFGKAEFTHLRQGIRFERVSYTYPSGTRALLEVSFDVPAGKTVALVGASGSGKTTLASLLLRFRPPTGGRILLDGQDYWEFSSESWHRAVGMVEQEAFLFHDTMAENIGYGFPTVAKEAVEAAVRAAYLEDVVAALPAGLETVIGERGTMLSGGQRQRLAIARALVRDPKILVLDEATSALDNLSERQVQAALERAMKGRTVLVIAHRLSTIRHADHIVVLDRGNVGEQGSWDELCRRPGLFKKMIEVSEGKPWLDDAEKAIPAEAPAGRPLDGLE